MLRKNSPNQNHAKEKIIVTLVALYISCFQTSMINYINELFKYVNMIFQGHAIAF